MKKKIAWMLGLLTIMAAVLCGCGTDPAAVDYNGYTYEELQNNVESDISRVQAINEFLATYEISVDDLYTHNYSSYYDYLISVGITDEEIAAVAAWNEVAEDFGTMTSTDTDSFSVSKAGNTLTTDLTLVFTAEDGSEKDIIFEVVYDYYSMEVSGISINPVYSMGEKLAKAGLNTLISISIVFVVLILISLIIYGFNIFPYLEKKKKEKAAAVSSAAPVAVSPRMEEEEVVPTGSADDTELIAVISAAIAASEGTSTSGFVVRSIHRR